MADKPAKFSTVDATTVTATTVDATTVVGDTVKSDGAMATDGATPSTHGIKIPAATPDVVASSLYSPDGAALYYNGSALATGSAVSGTTGQLAKFTAPTTLGDSVLSEAGTTMTELAKHVVQSGQTPSLKIGADSNAQTLTNATNKYGSFATPHYTNAENPVAVIADVNATAANSVLIGGGVTGLNAATVVEVYTGATTTTDTGTKRATFDANGVSDAVGSMVTLRAGGLGLASQAQYDLVQASSATQLARIAGVANAMLTTDGSKVPSLTSKLTIVPTVATLTDGATPALDASLGTIFRLAAAGDRTIAVPSNATAGQKLVIQHYASGGARTLALNTGAGGFRFGTDISALSQTASGKTDYIGAIYNGADSFWDVVAYTKGF